ncbi:MAG: ABC transporter ATP-binding protein/permease [Solobacterium sp.]|nr:ABC transporter ATP-binding protein/permease [Solobacterium sp.]
MYTGEKLDTKMLGRLLSYVLKRYRLPILIVMVCIVVNARVQVIGSLFQRTLIDDYIAPLIPAAVKDYGPLARKLFQMAGIYALGIIANFTYQKIMIRVTQGTMENIREDLFTHMETLPIRYFDTHAHGDIMSMYTNDTDTLRQVISQSIPSFFSSLLTIVMVFTSMVMLSPQLTVLSVCMIALLQIVLRRIMRLSGKYFMIRQNALAAENAYIEEMTEGARVIKVFNYENKAIERFTDLNDHLRESSYKANRYANIMGPVTGNFGNISYVLSAIVGSWLILSGHVNLTLGQLASFLALNRSFNMPVSQVAQQLNSVIMAMAGAKRIFSLMDEAPETDEGKVTLVNAVEKDGELVETAEETGIWAWKHPHADGSERLVRLTGDVRFYDVDFSYVPEKQVLYDIDLYAEPGQKLAFVGATGAGKTTMINLITRFYDVQHGQITYDGIDVQLIKKDDLRRSLGLVLQDTHLFTGTIEENIKYGKPGATHEEVVRAARLANAHYFIRHLENGYDTMLTGDGSALSQGQRQLLAIARAALANPPVLILDEATSSIDSRTEKLVQSGMDRLMNGRTTFVIAHRLSTIQNSNAIMVMDHGRIIERGNHASLLEKKGTYYRLYTGDLEID